MSSTDGRRARFEAMAETVFDPLQRYLRRRLDPEDAADAFAETLLVIWRRLDELPSSNPLPWCYGVARRVVANQKRGRQRHLRLVQRLAAEPPSPTMVEDSDPELEAAMDRLSSSDRELLHLWAWESLEPREIATALGLTPNAAALRLSRARKKLGEELARQDRPPVGHRADDTPRSKE